jgi:hypothetical protein
MLITETGNEFVYIVIDHLHRSELIHDSFGEKDQFLKWHIEQLLADALEIGLEEWTLGWVHVCIS